jgi:tyrosinase
MPRPKLVTKKGKAVSEWTISAKEMKEILPTALKTKTPQKMKRVASDIPVSKLRILPDDIKFANLMQPEIFWCKIYCPPRLRVRKNQKNLTPVEWARFIHAIEALASAGMPSPTYAEFVDIHNQAMTTPTGMSWGAHGGLKFLTWHREYLAKLEARLIMINPLVTIPYWNWVEDRAIPPQISNPADLTAWGVTRGATFNGTLLATAAQASGLMASGSFATFSTTLESSPFHNRVHGLVGGTFGTGMSPADPLFWLHHGFIDKLWADWQQTHPGAAFNPPSMTDTLQPPPIMTRTVGQVVSISALGYAYA